MSDVQLLPETIIYVPTDGSILPEKSGLYFVKNTQYASFFDAEIKMWSGGVYTPSVWLKPMPISELITIINKIK